MTTTARTGRPPTRDNPITQLASAVGGQRALSLLVGVSASTVKRWCAGAEPTKAERILLATIAATRGLPAPFDVT